MDEKMQTELTVKSQLDKFIDDVALHLVGEPDEKVSTSIRLMRQNLPELLARYDLGHDVSKLTELLISNIVQTRHEIRLGAGQLSKTLH
jgi:hypothetical protein